MVCRVCGDPATVEAHIVPRALYRDLAGDGQHAFEGSAMREGVRFQAKGLFDRTVLCRSHEAMLGDADDHGVRFVRGFEAEGRTGVGGNAWLVPNRRPDLLVRFAAACVWRRGVSDVHRDGADLDLGAAEPKLRRYLFEGGRGYDPPLMVKRRRIVSQGEPLREIMWPPGKAWGWGDGTWSFLAFGCEFVLKLNPFSSPSFHPCFVANGRTELWCLDMPPEEVSTVEGIVEIGANMLRGGRRGARRRPPAP